MAGYHLLLATALLALLPSSLVAQQSFPDPPPDLTKIYFLSGANDLSALPFESGITLLNVFQPAVEDKIARIRLKGPTATTVSSVQYHGTTARTIIA